MSTRLLLRTFSIFAISVALPVMTFAASTNATVIASDAPSITRADFLRASIQTLHIMLRNNVQLQYKTPVSAALQPYVKTALYYHALPFGNTLNLAQSVTRGEAILILSNLIQASPVHDYTSSYQDAAGDLALQKAIQIAIENQWLVPDSMNMFGADRVLSGAEAQSLFRAAILTATPFASSSSLSSVSVNSNSSSSIPTIRINLQGASSQPKKLAIPDQDILQAVWQLLNDQYLYNDKLSQQEAGYSAAEAMVNTLKDPYTTFLRPEPAQAFQDQIGGQITGIGAQVEYMNNILVIVAPIPGSPAAKAGLKPGDKILKVNGEDITNLGMNAAVAKIRGQKGTIALLHITRDGAEMDVSVTRDTIMVPEIDISFQGNVAVVKIAQFGETTDKSLRDNMIKVAAQKPKGIILDLRNNPGGLLTAADTVVSNFLPKGSTVAHIMARAGETIESTKDDPTIDPSIPMVVLVNKGSASASEITAGALQDYKRATIIGEQSFGKGTVQQILEFRDGSEIKMTIAEWLTPLKRKINGLGVTPDIVVPAGDTRDEQMLKALDILR